MGLVDEPEHRPGAPKKPTAQLIGHMFNKLCIISAISSEWRVIPWGVGKTQFLEPGVGEGAQLLLPLPCEKPKEKHVTFHFWGKAFLPFLLVPGHIWIHPRHSFFPMIHLTMKIQ